VTGNPPFLTDKVIGLISTSGGVQGLQAVITMEFVVRALRGMAVPLVAPVARAYRAFDESGHVIDEGIERQLRRLITRSCSPSNRERIGSGATWTR
jgi:FMN reductase